MSEYIYSIDLRATLRQKCTRTVADMMLDRSKTLDIRYFNLYTCAVHPTWLPATLQQKFTDRSAIDCTYLWNKVRNAGYHSVNVITNK